ncbi:MAG: bifunctional ADP-dependent NAD(P)H-hydrate dehydratase/NAD(P)H-hydrate epimerase [Christensenellales bacterium]
MDGATGQVLGDAVHARETVTFHRAKHGLLLYPGRAYAGKLTVADIGILPEWDGAQGIDVLEETDACALLPVRPGDGHKGTFGHVLSVAGSEGMAGAATLCARSALRAGAGLVTAACPFAVLNTVQAQAPCAMAKVVADGASLDAGAADMLKELAEHKAALAVGPGLGREEGAWLAIEALVKSDIPKVIDADALFLLAKHGGGVGTNTVLTPHPGEMARLCGTTVQAVWMRRWSWRSSLRRYERMRAAQGRDDGDRARRGRGDERHGL